MHIVWGLVWIAISFVLIRYRHKIHHFTGSWGLVERYLGPGRTPQAIVLVAILVFFIGVTIMIGFSDKILGGAERYF